jgi:hypothetical protein
MRWEQTAKRKHLDAGELREKLGDATDRDENQAADQDAEEHAFIHRLGESQSRECGQAKPEEERESAVPRDHCDRHVPVQVHGDQGDSNQAKHDPDPLSIERQDTGPDVPDRQHATDRCCDAHDRVGPGG